MATVISSAVHASFTSPTELTFPSYDGGTTTMPSPADGSPRAHMRTIPVRGTVEAANGLLNEQQHRANVDGEVAVEVLERHLHKLSGHGSRSAAIETETARSSTSTCGRTTAEGS
jgi:hypothetical protein